MFVWHLKNALVKRQHESSTIHFVIPFFKYNLIFSISYFKHLFTKFLYRQYILLVTQVCPTCKKLKKYILEDNTQYCNCLEYNYLSTMHVYVQC